MTLSLVKPKKTFYTVRERCWEPRGSKPPRSEPKDESAHCSDRKSHACTVYTGLARSTATAWQATQGTSETFVQAARPALSPSGGSELGAVDLERGRPAHGVGGLAVARQLRDGDGRGLARGETRVSSGAKRVLSVWARVEGPSERARMLLSTWFAARVSRSRLAIADGPSTSAPSSTCVVPRGAGTRHYWPI